MANSITVSATIKAPLSKVWEGFTKPEHITQWAFASDDWEAPYAENDIRTGGKFLTKMAAKDKSFAFDFAGVYSNVVERQLIEYDLGDSRKVSTKFNDNGDGTVTVMQTFDMEGVNSEEKQRSGWQAIMDNFKKHVEEKM